MSDKNKQQPNNPHELIDIKSLIGNADGGGYTLDEILSEYGVPPQHEDSGPESGEDEGSGLDLPWPEAPHRPRRKDNVVMFPGASSAPDQDREAQEEPEEGEALLPEAEEQEAPVEEEMELPQEGQDEGADNVIQFPEEETPLESLLKDLKGRANDYADRMFEESEQMDQEEIRRLEELIPGTDQEDEAEDARYVRRPPRQEPPPPDLSPQELARRYGKGLKGMRLRVILLFFLTLLSLLPLLIPLFGLVWMPPLDDYKLQVLLSAGILGVGTALSLDVLAQALFRAFRLKFGMDTMTLLACCFTLADAVVLASRQNRAGELPYCAVTMVALLFLVHGEYHKRCALRLNCRTAAAAAEPYVVTLEPGLWNGKDTYIKWSGVPTGFGSQVQMDDGAQRIYKIVCPVLAVGCAVLSVLATVGAGKQEHLLWGLSSTFTAASALGGALAFGRSYHKITRRLSHSGAALAGWPGMAGSRRGSRLLVTDWDLFPPGHVQLNGIKVFGDLPVERVVAYTATLIRDSGSGLEKLFHDLLRSQGAIFRRAEDLKCYEGGGLSATIRGDRVLVGSAAFMNLMEVELPQGLNVKNAVFCAIEGELAGIFALNYTLPDLVFPAFSSLLRERVTPVLGTRDFNVIPAMLQQRFKLAADRMDFPPVQRRRELSDPDQEHSATLTAVLCREGLGPFAEAVVGARRLRLSTRVGAALSCFGSALGLLLTYYLVSVEAFSSLAALNLLIYLIMWLVPVWFLTDWAPRF